MKFDILKGQDSPSVIVAMATCLNNQNCGNVRMIQWQEKWWMLTMHFTRKHTVSSRILHYLEWCSFWQTTGMLNAKTGGRVPQPNEILVTFCRITSKSFFFFHNMCFSWFVLHETFWINPFYDILLSKTKLEKNQVSCIP